MPVHNKRQLEISEMSNGNVCLNNEITSNGKMEFEFEKDDNKCIVDACMTGNIPIINEYLSTHKVNDCLSSGWTLLLHAAFNAQPQVVEYLLDHGANPNKHHDGFTPLMAISTSTKALPDQRLECLQSLIKAKANIDAVSKLKETALMFACKMQESDFVLELLKYTKDIDCYDSEQKTALFYAVADNRIENARLLIEKGANTAWMNFRGFTVYEIAVTKGYDQILLLLNDDEKSEQEEIFTDCTLSWFNMFSTMAEINLTSLDSDVASILYGMGLDGYKASFLGMSLKTILQLKEEDLIKIGIDISVHRKKFIEDLLRFHKYEWSSAVIRIDESQPFTPFEAIKLLGSLNRQLIVMSSGISFAKTWFDSIKQSGHLTFSNDDQEKYETSIHAMQNLALQIEDVVKKIRHTASLINRENSYLTLPIYINKKSKFNCKWVSLAIAAALAGVCLIRMKSISN